MQQKIPAPSLVLPASGWVLRKDRSWGNNFHPVWTSCIPNHSVLASTWAEFQVSIPSFSCFLTSQGTEHCLQSTSSDRKRGPLLFPSLHFISPPSFHLDSISILSSQSHDLTLTSILEPPAYSQRRNALVWDFISV